MDVVMTLMGDPQVVFYFLTLFASIAYCFSFSKQNWPIVASLVAMSVTWFYICRWTLEYKLSGGMNLFDDAYVDVLSVSHSGISTQLLMWVVVATVWMHEASPFYMLFGMLGAMSSAFVTWVPNCPKSGRYVPIMFLPCSVTSIIAIYQLPIVLSIPVDFSFWLKLLHITLVLPQLSLCVCNQVKVDGVRLYRLLAVVIVIMHNTSASMPWPTTFTDCQLSITCDLVLCSAITMYAIYRDTQSLLWASVACFLMPLISPGAVLAGYLSIYHNTHGDGVTSNIHIHSSIVTKLQETFARYAHQKGHALSSSESDISNIWSRSGAKSSTVANLSSEPVCSKALCEESSLSDAMDPLLWMNLGCGWGSPVKGNGVYQKACQRLADSLGDAVFQAKDGVLACGCGYGAELLHWKHKYSLEHITGIDLNPLAADRFPLHQNIRLIQLPVSQMFEKFQHRRIYNKIVALDCIYHFDDKVKFFMDCGKLLPDSGGAVGVTDLLLCSQEPLPWWLLVLLKCMNVTTKCLWSKQLYRQQLEESGWIDVKITPFSHANVLNAWFPSLFGKYLEYGIVTAKRAAVDMPRKRPTVAVIGSGLSGLTAAYALRGTHDVTVIEAKDKAGLSGQGEEVFGQIIDIPLRIIGQGYYTHVEHLAASLDVKIARIRDDNLSQTHYGDPSAAPFSYSRSYVYNFISALPYVGELIKFSDHVYADTGSVEGSAPESWGEWMVRHGYSTNKYGTVAGREKYIYHKDDQDDKDQDIKDAYIMWLFMGQASWMLSCTYQQILDYPAHILLAFVKSLGLGKDIYDTVCSSASQSGHMLRIQPSMVALEYALTYAIPCLCSTRVQHMTSERIIAGTKYDYVVVATEASAVKHILSPDLCHPAFSRVAYQPSSILLHTDPSVMPTGRANWRAFNICQAPSHDMCMLTAWLNQYYSRSCFPQDVFQTWNPHIMPKADCILKEVNFLRVVHNSDTSDIQKEIHEQQGKHSIYYAGAYSVEGMGLLEQAAQAGEKVAAMILAHSISTPTTSP